MRSSCIGFLCPDRSVDFGHLDVLVATDAPVLVWEPIRGWVLAH